MLILGDISGIHQFVTNVAHVGGGQAKRLRARSFFVQALCDAAAVKLLHGLSCESLDETHLLMAAAGHFILRVEDRPGLEPILEQHSAEMNGWLLSELSGEIRLSLAWARDGGTEMEQFLRARRQLSHSALRPWASIAMKGGSWNVGKLMLAPLDTPCQLCRERPGEVPETDDDSGEERTICRLCDSLKALGGALTQASWLEIVASDAARPAASASVSAFGLRVALYRGAAMPPRSPSTLGVADLAGQVPHGTEGPYPGKMLPRVLARYVPTSPGPNGSTLDLRSIAKKSTGDHKLGVLKADGDGMGEFWSSIFETDQDLNRYRAKSREFDDFSAREINQMLVDADAQKSPRRYVYTVFSGGDDLLFVGPWDIILEFAGVVSQRFRERFAEDGLTISAGVGIIRPGWPIRRAAQLAEDLLHQAKSAVAGAAPGDQIAALGQVWKWADHESILEEGKRWASWVQDRVLDRGWLQRLRELNEAQDGRRNRTIGPNTVDRTAQMMASARLSYSIDRLVKSSSRIRDCKPLRDRLHHLTREFETRETTRARYLSASLLYASMSTRTPSAEDRDDMA